MKEIFNFPKKFENWPDNTNSGKCEVLFHMISDNPLIIHTWLKCYFILDKQMSIQIENYPDIPNGIYRVLTILFYAKGSKRHFLAATNPFHYTMNDLFIENGQINEAPLELVKTELDKWEKSISIGKKSDVKKIKHAEAHFICSDCLITRPVKIGPAELYPLSKSGIVDLSSSIREAMLFQGLRDVPFNDIAEAIFKQSDRRSPLFCMSFHRIYREDKEVIAPLMPYIKRIFGILCINRGAYSRLLGGVYLKQYDGYKNVHYINLNSYYRGNLMGGSLSNEKPELWNEQYTLSQSSSFKSEILSKLNSAYSEVDLDISYFRHWSIIESVANVVYGDKKLPIVKILLQKVYSSQDVEKTITLKLGDCNFSFDDLLSMWLDWRNCTAHDGGIHAYFAGYRKVHPKIEAMINEMKKLNFPVEFGEDRSLMLLKDVSTKVVEAYISDRINSN